MFLQKPELKGTNQHPTAEPGKHEYKIAFSPNVCVHWACPCKRGFSFLLSLIWPCKKVVVFGNFDDGFLVSGRLTTSVIGICLTIKKTQAENTTFEFATFNCIIKIHQSKNCALYVFRQKLSHLFN